MDLSGVDIDSLVSLNNETIIISKRMQPTDWYESKQIMMPQNSAIPGYVKYSNTPYWKEPVNCISPDHPAKDITIVGPAQDGKTFMVLEPMIGYTIECNPGSILHLTGNSDLAPDAALRVDTMIDNCKLRYLIQPPSGMLTKRTGDTAIRKEFPNGIYRVNSITKKNALRQNDIMLLILDDADAAKRIDSKVGNIWNVARDRTKAFESKHKRVCTSSPETLSTSLVWEVFLRSDQRYYYVPCPCCHEFIELKFHIQIDEKEHAGLTWRLDSLGRVDPKTVNYLCQKCAGAFTDKYKMKLMQDGKWIPSCEAKDRYHYGYKKSGLYAPHGLTSWLTICEKASSCMPEGQPRIESSYQTFVNGTLGDPYEPITDDLNATKLMENVRPYEAGTVPQDLSKQDGNGDIVMLTCAVDLNGVYNKPNREDDVRLDYEVLAWSATGATYSVIHGSIGTFISRETQEQKKIPREKWTYDFNKENNVWRELDKVLGSEYPINGTNKKMRILIVAMDTGYCEAQAFDYIDRQKFWIVGIKGNPENKHKPLDKDTKNFQIGKSRSNLYILDGFNIKEDLAACMRMRWDKRSGETQPYGASCAGGFMNYPGLGLQKIQNGVPVTLYQFGNYFCHYEAEHKVPEYNSNREVIGHKWEKKDTTVQNHFWDCRYYNIGAREILLHEFFTAAKLKSYTWANYVDLVLGKSDS